jgi:hypothetical protein
MSGAGVAGVCGIRTGIVALGWNLASAERGSEVA